ncbi:NYN domain-containing protein, partial [candidate division WOR-3 bacterium]|nr:NYN domain-containing protein [candidate division WOR-3 bacterium]MBD3365227.1 NYN domain-containing protein [candidate division WOR-3 bacterium]
MRDYLKTVVFIDGENLHYNLRSFEFREEHSKPFHLLPQYINWEKFFKALLDKINDGSNIKHFLHRIYWYVIERISAYREPGSDKLTRAVRKCQELSKTKIVDSEKVQELAKEWHSTLSEKIRHRRDALHTVLQTHTDFLQFKYVGKLAVDPFKVRRCETDSSEPTGYAYDGTIHSEKGVDIALAVDMVSLASDYDVAVLV